MSEQPTVTVSRTDDSLGLDALALEDRVLDIYLDAVRSLTVSAENLVAEGYAEPLVSEALEILTRRGLLRRIDDSTWEATPPEIGIPTLASRLEARSAAIRAIAMDLSQVYHRARTRNGVQGTVTVLNSLRDIHNATMSVAAHARTHIRALRDNSPRTTHLFSLDLAAHRERSIGLDGTALKVRTTYDVSVLKLPRAGEVLRARAAGGEESRFLANIPFTAVVADSSLAVIDVTAYDSSGAGSILVNDPRLVRSLVSLTDTLWNLAAPTATPGDTLQLDERSQTILSLLAAGATDAVIASQTGFSQRTVERNVRLILDRLGAATRFQAGVQAARRGWL